MGNRRDIIVIGASTGGIEALCGLVAEVPAGLPATVFIVCHFPAGAVSNLPEILSRRGPLLANHARDGEPAYPGQIYVAPPDLHLEVRSGTLRLTRGPRENRFRPSIDVLFRSAARAYGPRTIAVVLSGGLTDGVAGLMAVRAAGGLAVVQDPADAIIPDLPLAALRMAGADQVFPAAEIGRSLATLMTPAASAGGFAMSDPVDRILQKVESDMGEQAHNGRPGQITVLTCPECGGSLWQANEGRLVSFRCHVGHVYAADALLVDKTEVLEAALWTAVRMFKEKAILSHQLAAGRQAEGNRAAAERLEEDARLAERQAAVIQTCLQTTAAASVELGNGPASPLPSRDPQP
ncbi:MAG: chemotaxis protein CheB [Gemmataceae bacterium]